MSDIGYAVEILDLGTTPDQQGKQWFKIHFCYRRKNLKRGYEETVGKGLEPMYT